MNDNLPEINFKEKKEKKGGALGWLKGRLGIGSRGAMGEAGITPSAMNVGRAMGAGRFGASAGLKGLLAGKAGMLATVAAVAVSAGVYLANQAPAPNMGASSFSGGKVQDNYVPAILRSQAANQGSSLDMFKETNKGAGLSMEEDPSKKNKPKPEESAPASAEEAAADGQVPAPEQGNMAQEMMGKLQGGESGSLTSSLGGGSNKFSAMGGFGNKFNQGATGGKPGFTSGIGSGFQGMPKFDQRKGKMLAMKASSKPIFNSGKSGKKAKFGAGAFGQAKGIRAVQSYSGRDIDQMAGSQNKAWEGSTPEGGADGGAGLGEGGAGIMSSPSLDNAGGSAGGGGMNNPEDPTVPDVGSPTDVSPWANTLTQVMMLVLISCALSWIASMIALFWVRWIVAALALIAALAAIVLAAQIMSKYGQKLMGALYIIGGVMAAIAAIMSFAGKSDKAPGTEKTGWLMMGAAVVSMIGSMLGGK